MGNFGFLNGPEFEGSKAASLMNARFFRGREILVIWFDFEGKSVHRLFGSSARRGSGGAGRWIALLVVKAIPWPE